MDIYNFKNYKTYLKKVLGTTGQNRGRRSLLAKFLNCQTGYISQVLNGDSHFSLEHGVLISNFLNHDQREMEFFMLLLQHGRAGSHLLKRYYLEQIETKIASRLEVKNRISVNQELTDEDHMEYYSHWYYSAIHILVSIDEFQTKNQIFDRFNLSSDVLNRVLEFLVQKNLVIEENGRYKIGPTRIHLTPDSPMISKHHINWRLEGIKSLEKNDPNDLHYSLVMSLSKGDAKKIKNILLDAIQSTDTILTDSPEEELYAFGIDYFKII